jgi:hypothetical protein
MVTHPADAIAIRRVVARAKDHRAKLRFSAKSGSLAQVFDHAELTLAVPKKSKREQATLQLKTKHKSSWKTLYSGQPVEYELAPSGLAVLGLTYQLDDYDHVPPWLEPPVQERLIELSMKTLFLPSAAPMGLMLSARYRSDTSWRRRMLVNTQATVPAMEDLKDCGLITSLDGLDIQHSSPADAVRLFSDHEAGVYEENGILHLDLPFPKTDTLTIRTSEGLLELESSLRPAP